MAATMRTLTGLVPVFRRTRTPHGSGTLRLDFSPEARAVKEAGRRRVKVLNAQDNENQARLAVIRLGGDPSNRQHLLGQYKLNHTAFAGQTFVWLLSNALSYSGWLVDQILHSKEVLRQGDPISEAKFALKEYLLSFDEGREVLETKAKDRENRAAARTAATSLSACAKVSSGPTPSTSTQTVAASSSSTADTLVLQEVHLDEDDDKALAEAARVLEELQGHRDPQQSAGTAGPSASVSSPSTSLPKHPATEYVLPPSLQHGLPEADRGWVGKVLFKRNARGNAELVESQAAGMWLYPPQPHHGSSSSPRLEEYFARPVFIWLPKRVLRCVLRCPSCSKELSMAGLYSTVRQVVSTDGYYSLITEYLECTKCRKKYAAWSHPIMKQLDGATRCLFPAILTYRYACDKRVIGRMRERGVGNGPHQLQKILREEHALAHKHRVALYASRCHDFVKACQRGLISACPSFPEPPRMHPVPKYGWLLTVYLQDVLQRLGQVKAAITSTFGSILKLDSTKKITRKLAGHASGTAEWCTNVGNEYGQVLISVLTAAEGGGLQQMASGLMQRYADAQHDPPVAIYVDRDCCSPAMRAMFHQWPDTDIKLDAWHFMRRIASGVNSESHQLYGIFMARLSQCIFEWDPEDMRRLLEAKREELEASQATGLSDLEVSRCIGRRERERHCRRAVRRPEAIRTNIQQLLETFDGEHGRDTLGVPLLNSPVVWDEWEKAQRHLHCLQDPDPARCSLYVQTGTHVKGTKMLPVFRCARGSTSLESFHQHLKSFIPGQSAGDAHFQAFLLEGIMRWNRNRERQVLGTAALSYDDSLDHVVNTLYSDVWGQTLDPHFHPPKVYTGELIGIEYLYSQTDQPLESLQHPPQLAEDESDGLQPMEDDADVADEGFEEASDPTVMDDIPDTDARLSPAPSSVTRPAPLSLTAESSPASLIPAATAVSEHQQETDPDPGSDSESQVPPSADDYQECRDTHGVGGYDKVCNLANHLVHLRDRDTPLSTGDARSIISLWNELHDFDKRPTSFQPRYKKGVPKGRFKSSKTWSDPGVVATKRCFRGQNKGPAAFPQANRVMEAVLSRLLQVHPANIRRGDTRVLRLTLVERSYRRIRSLVVNCPMILQETCLQLAEINATTLRQWINRKSKGEELEVLKQGVEQHAPQPAATATRPLPAPAVQPAALQPPPSLPDFDFQLPESTRGMAKPRKRQKKASFNVAAGPASASAPPVQPKVSGPITLTLNIGGMAFKLEPLQPDVTSTPAATVTAAQPSTILPAVTATQPPVIAAPAQATTLQLPVLPTADTERSVPSSTQSYRKRRLKAEEAGTTKRSRYNRKEGTTCGQCGKERSLPDHRQYFGKWWCRDSSDVTYHQWLQERKDERAAKKANK